LGAKISKILSNNPLVGGEEPHTHTHKKKGTKKIALANLKKCTERGKKAYDIDPVGAAKQGQPASPRFGKKAKK